MSTSPLHTVTPAYILPCFKYSNFRLTIIIYSFRSFFFCNSLIYLFFYYLSPLLLYFNMILVQGKQMERERFNDHRASFDAAIRSAHNAFVGPTERSVSVKSLEIDDKERQFAAMIVTL